MSVSDLSVPVGVSVRETERVTWKTGDRVCRTDVEAVATGTRQSSSGVWQAQLSTSSIVAAARVFVCKAF